MVCTVQYRENRCIVQYRENRALCTVQYRENRALCTVQYRENRALCTVQYRENRALCTVQYCVHHTCSTIDGMCPISCDDDPFYGLLMALKWFLSNVFLGAARSVLSSGTIGLMALLWICSVKNDGLAGARFGGLVFQPPFPELAGGLRAAAKFLGEVDGSVMQQLLNTGMFKQVMLYDYQAMCKIGYHHHSGARPLLSPFYGLLMALKWFLSNVFLFLMEFNFCGFWHSDSIVDAHKHKKHDMLQPCDTEYPAFVYEPSVKETNSLIECGTCQNKKLTVVTFQRLLGLMAAASQTLPLGLLHMCLLQGWFNSRVFQHPLNSGRQPTVSRHCLQALSWLTQPAHLRIGIALGSVTRREVIITDASSLGWGTVWNGRGAQGVWRPCHGRQCFLPCKIF
ncbi:UNVERIFIED_CONTAM: hypothetical protein FKN15_007572 [Acipenser sinensis]